MTRDLKTLLLAFALLCGALTLFSQDMPPSPPDGGTFGPPIPPEFRNMSPEERQARFQEFIKRRQDEEQKVSDQIEKVVSAPSSNLAAAAPQSVEQGENKGAEQKPPQQVESARPSFVSLSRQSDDNSEESLIASLLSNNPFGIAKPSGASLDETLGIYLKSVAMMDGIWHFSLVSKDGRSAWLKIGEESSELSCKVLSFDENSMTVKTLISGRAYDMAIVERSAASSSGKVELVDALKPRKPMSPEERMKVWSYASDEQKNAANQIYQAARAAGRRLNHNDFRKLRDIERNIKIPENNEQKR